LQVEVQYAIKNIREVPTKTYFSRWAEAAMEGETETGLVIRIVDKEECSALNSAYRGRSGPTNVLSFPYEAPPQIEMSYLGDVVICAEIVEREAAEQQKECFSHWAHMVIHGILHLRGYDHQTEAQAAAMQSREARIMVGLGYADPYA
jgi:probable rRNA maturation factor